MSDQQAPHKKPSASRNIRKLAAVSRVCSLAGSWQRWVKENERKQASEPSGWAPSWQGGPLEEPKNAWIPRMLLQAPEKPEADAQHQQGTSEKALQIPAQKEEAQVAAGSEEVQAPAEPIASTIVVKTANSSVHQKSAGSRIHAEGPKNDGPPLGEAIDELLRRKCLPTRRRKCTNIVSSLSETWRQVENREMLGEGGPAEEQVGAEDDGGRPGVEERKEAHMSQTDPEVDSQLAVKIRRPPAAVLSKEAENVKKINALSKKHSAVGTLRSRWQSWASDHAQNQRLNPFSEYFDYDYSMSLRLQKGQDGYGHPKEGTKTAERAKRAEQHIHREIADMCYVIRTMADPDTDGKTHVTFGELFDRYVRISDKVVGILMRARKHGRVAFEGEMLWQGQDDGVIITLLV